MFEPVKTILLLLMPMLCWGQQQPGGYDVRAVRWGMTQAQVVASEKGRKPFKDAQGNLSFSGIEVAKCPTTVEYKFEANKVKEAVYIIKAETKSDIMYYLDFQDVQARLEEKYGDKPKGGYLWHKETYKDKSQEYGYAIRIGDVSILYEWIVDRRTRIIHAIMGRDNKVLHTVNFEQLPTDDF